MTNLAVTPPREPHDFGWLVDNFAASTPGVTHALIVSSEGLPLIAAGGMPADLADPLAAMTSGIISLGNNIASKVGEGGTHLVLGFSQPELADRRFARVGAEGHVDRIGRIDRGARVRKRSVGEHAARL